MQRRRVGRVHAGVRAHQHRGELAHAGAEAQLIEKPIKADVELPEILLGQGAIRIYPPGSGDRRLQQPLEVAQLLKRDRGPTLDQAPTHQPDGRQRERLGRGDLDPVPRPAPRTAASAGRMLGSVLVLRRYVLPQQARRDLHSQLAEVRGPT